MLSLFQVLFVDRSQGHSSRYFSQQPRIDLEPRQSTTIVSTSSYHYRCDWMLSLPTEPVAPLTFFCVVHLTETSGESSILPEALVRPGPGSKVCFEEIFH